MKIKDKIKFMLVIAVFIAVVVIVIFKTTINDQNRNTEQNPYLNERYQQSLVDDEGMAIDPKFVVDYYVTLEGVPDLELSRTSIKVHLGGKVEVIDLKNYLKPVPPFGPGDFDPSGQWGTLGDFVYSEKFEKFFFTIFDPNNSGTGVQQKSLYFIDLKTAEFERVGNVENSFNFKLSDDEDDLLFEIGTDQGIEFRGYNIETGEYTLISEDEY